MKQQNNNEKAVSAVDARLNQLLDRESSLTGEPVGTNQLTGFSQNIQRNNELWSPEPLRPIASDRKFIGKPIVFLKRAIRKLTSWYILPPWQKQTEFNASVTRSLNDAYNTIKDLTEQIEQLKDKLSENQQLVKKVEMLEPIVMSNRKRTEKVNDLAEKISLLESCVMEDDELTNFHYVKFEDKFRGSREVILERQQYYLKYFTDQAPVLDIGCGRGEFLELLSKNNIENIGCEIDKEMYKLCKERGFNVVFRDGINYLEDLEDESLGGIFISQVVEHLLPKQIISIVNLAYKKLKKGSYCIIETPNPLTLGIFCKWFYTDLSHRQPVHPYTLEYLCENAGFAGIELTYLNEAPETEWFTILENRENNPNIQEFNKGIIKMNQLINGAQDYAVIARK